MKFGLLHFRVYETDGVSLEMDKWKIALEKLGHEVVYISGTKTTKESHIYLDDLYYLCKDNEMFHQNCFDKLVDFKDEAELLLNMDEKANKIERKLHSIILENNIDVLVPNNVSSLGFNIPVGVAIGRLNEKEICKFMYHHHDFYFERKRYSNPLFGSIDELLKQYFPFKGKAVHCCINNIAASNLYDKKGIKAFVVPNVFDFDQPLWVKDDYNRGLRKQLGIAETDIVFLQATRIVERKAIEYAADIVDAFTKQLPKLMGKRLYNNHEITSETKVHFVLAGLNELSDDKFNILDKYISNRNYNLHYINDIVTHSREDETYSLWDIYTMCDIITYPSILEGWGNQLLEGLFAKKPLIVYEYPVFNSDISNYNFDLITFFEELNYDDTTDLLQLSQSKISDVTIEINNVLTNSFIYNKVVVGNFSVCKNHLSYSSLQSILSNLIKHI